MTNLDNQNRDNKPHKTVPLFDQRFNIKVPDKEAKQRFLNRVRNRIDGFFSWLEDQGEQGQELKYDIMWQVANSLGKIFEYGYDFNYYIAGDFYTCLQALEIVYHQLNTDEQKEELDSIIQTILFESEIDLAVQWREEAFLPSGAKLLDEALVNEPLQWLSDPRHHSVLAPFEKGLRHFMEATKHPERLADTVTDMYEALEAMAKVATGRPNKDLSGNRELFVKKLGLTDYYNRMLKDYISYANEFRHAVKEGEERKPPLAQEVEAFIYTTGLFIRLAIERLNIQKSVSP